MLSESVDVLRIRVKKSPRDMEGRLALAAALADADDTFAALVEFYHAHTLNRRREDILLQIDSLAKNRGTLEPFRRRLSDVFCLRYDRAPLPEPLMGLGREARIDLLRLLFERLDPFELHGLPPTDFAPIRTLEISGVPIDPKSIREFASLRGQPAQLSSLQAELLDTGSLSLRSPFTGTTVTSRESLLVVLGIGRPFLLYYFRDIHPFLVLMHPFAGEPWGIYLPDQNACIADEAFSPNQRAIALIKAMVIEFAEQTCRHLSSAERKAIAVLYGSMNHIGHAVLNEYEGMHQAAVGRHLEKIDCVLRAWSTFMPYDPMYPELAAREEIFVGTPTESFQAVIERGLMVIRPTVSKLWYSPGLRTRMIRCAHFLATDEVMREISAARSHSPLIWFEIRSNDRAWVNQVEGIAAAVNELAKDYPHLAIVVAGWSRPWHSRQSSFDEKAVASDLSLGAGIKGLVSPSIPVYDITGISTPHKILWAEAIDLFVAGYSSGLVFPLCAANKTGVLHCTSEYLRRIAENNGHIDFMQDHEDLYIMDPSRVRDHSGRSYQIANYELDWRDVLDGIRTILANRREWVAHDSEWYEVGKSERHGFELRKL